MRTFSIIFKILPWFIGIFLALILFACCMNSQTGNGKQSIIIVQDSNGDNLKIREFTYEGHEYIFVSNYSGNSGQGGPAHKPNCKNAITINYGNEIWTTKPIKLAINFKAFGIYRTENWCFSYSFSFA